ncbi:hypothetical protein GCM10025298_31020 [Natronobiforma cellulositropha]
MLAGVTVVAGGIVGCLDGGTDGSDDTDTPGEGERSERDTADADPAFVCEGEYRVGGSVRYRESPESGVLYKYDDAQSALEREYERSIGVRGDPLDRDVLEKIGDEDGATMVGGPYGSGIVALLGNGRYWDVIESAPGIRGRAAYARSAFDDARAFVEYCDPDGRDLLLAAIDIGSQRSELLAEAATEFETAAERYLDAGLHEVDVVGDDGTVLGTTAIGVESPDFDPAWAPEANEHYNRGVALLDESFILAEDVPSNIHERISLYDPESGG